MKHRAAVHAAAAVAVALAVAAGWGLFWRTAFSHNPKWEVREVEIETGLAKTPEEIRDITGLREGVNLFAFSAAEARRRRLDSTLNIAEAEVGKTLPGRVRIVARDRVPAAKLFSESLAVDANGLVFTLLEKDRSRWH
ncbi:MAG: FtsQ-type POTRA domain-containing protein, partial [Kiritimatiellae bacterium]|nr:FtsQ-type POTRA domain-containing protein [Kiritimatiellia bacterium]